jgi:hypothetical protein
MAAALFPTVLFLSSCFSSSGNGDGIVAVAVYNAHRPAGLAADEPLPEVLQVETFRVLITGEKMDPVEIFFPGDAAGGSIKGIKKGENRTVLVEAINKFGQVVRRREITGVAIRGGKETPIVASLLSVPIVTNLKDGNLVTQTRLVFQGYAEPGGSLEIEDSYNSALSVLPDLSSSSNMISPSLSLGGFTFKPPVLPLGPHTFTLRDPESGEESQITLILVRPGRQPGVGLTSAGKIVSAATDTAGGPGLFPEVVEAMAR